MARTTKEIIDQAIRENRAWEYLLMGLSCLFAVLGAALIIWTSAQKQWLGTAAGAAESYLFLPAVRIAVGIRKANIMLRTLEIPLSKAATAQEAAEMLNRVCESNFLISSQQKKRGATGGF